MQQAIVPTEIAVESEHRGVEGPIGHEAFLNRNVLRRCAAIPSLIAVEAGYSTQGAVKEALRSHFAPHTVVEGLRALEEEGFLERRRLAGGRRGVEYTITNRGTRLLSTPVRAAMTAIIRPTRDIGFVKAAAPATAPEAERTA